MKVMPLKDAPRYDREGSISYLLASSRTCGAAQMTVTLVDVAPGGRQPIHSHETEQCYVIIEGTGVMTVGDETSEVSSGDCIFIPGGSKHGLVNSGDATLRYVSAASPGFDEFTLQGAWPLPSNNEEIGDGSA